MNDCSQTKVFLMLAADGDLDAEQAAWLEGHVALCPACRMEQVRFRELDRDLSAYGDFREQVAPAAAPRRIAWMAQWIPAMAAALAATLLLAVILVHRLGPARPSAPAEEAFVPIPYVLPLDPYERGTVMRMEVPVAALIAVGYKMDTADPTAVVTADVLVGEDGRAHGVHVLSGFVLN